MDLFNTKKIGSNFACLDRKKQKDGCAVNQIKWDLSLCTYKGSEWEIHKKFVWGYVKIKNKGEEHLRSL